MADGTAPSYKKSDGRAEVMETPYDRRAAAGRLVSSTLQFRQRAGTLSGAKGDQSQIQIATRQDSVRCAAGLRRLADRIRGLGSRNSPHL